MPTGYTAPIEDGCSFEEYVWGCARAFGACIELRDSPDEKIPAEFAPSRYHLEAMDKAKGELASLEMMTKDQIQTLIDAEVEDIEVENEKYRRDHALKMSRYEQIRDKVEAWEPPTPDHAGLKKFMLEQIDDSVRFGSPYQREPISTTPFAYRQDRKARLLDDIEYHREHYADDVRRARERSEWIRALRASVPQPASR